MILDSIKAGGIVISGAGHDCGRAMLVVSVEGNVVYVADGKERKLTSPKKKNIKHVRPTKSSIELDGLTDKKLRQTLRAFSSSVLQESE